MLMDGNCSPMESLNHTSIVQESDSTKIYSRVESERCFPCHLYL